MTINKKMEKIDKRFLKECNDMKKKEFVCKNEEERQLLFMYYCANGLFHFIDEIGDCLYLFGIKLVIKK